MEDVANADRFHREAVEKLKRRQGPYSVAAVFIWEDQDDPSRDGVRWHFAVTDGRKVTTLAADLSGTNSGHRNMEVDVAALEYIVEEIAGRYPLETRVQDMLADSPLVIDPDRTRIIFT